MDSLPSDLAQRVAESLWDERDLTALACTCSRWRRLLAPNNEALWRSLLQQRFGAAGCASPALRFAELAALRQPAARLEKIIWLDGSHLQAVELPDATYGTAIRVRDVCWLELAGRFAGVLPGRYRAAWRVRLEPASYLDEVLLVARPEPPAGAEAALEHHGGAATRLQWSAMQRLEPTAAAWFEVCSQPFDVRQLGSVAVEWQALSGSWKRGILFDCVRLVREQPGQRAQAQQEEAGNGAQGLFQRLAGLFVRR